MQIIFHTSIFNNRDEFEDGSYSCLSQDLPLEEHSETFKTCLIVTLAVETLQLRLLGIALLILTSTAGIKMTAVLNL